jgi:uncharacterized YigZ family protein
LDGPASIRSLHEPFEYELDPIKGSRFLACLAPVADEAEAKAFVASVRERFKDARHHCFAWRLGPGGESTRSSDDGEPSGSAGRPILMQLEGHGVTDLACVVVRWFGGVKLGVGGLVRAYGGAAGKALDRAPMAERPVTVALMLRYPWECSNAVQAVLHAHALKEGEAQFGEGVEQRLEVPLALAERVTLELRERSAGRVEVTRPGA